MRNKKLNPVFKASLRLISTNPMLNVVTILLSAGLVALADTFVPPEVPVDAFYVLPIWLGLVGFGRAGGFASATLSIGLFYLSNYVLAHDNRSSLGWSIAITYSILMLFAYGTHQFLLGQRQLEQTRLALQTRLNELDELYQRSQALHEVNLRLALTEERNRLAREIHDVLAQGIMAILLQVEVAQSSLNNPAKLAQCLAQIERLAHHNLQEARRSVANLRPLPLDGFTLEQALKSKVAEFSRDGIEALFSTSGHYRSLSKEIEDTLYRITQEALNNVNRHARASRVVVTLDYDEDEVCLTVQDDGQGFNPKALTPPTQLHFNQAEEEGLRGGYGVTTMQERARLVGGWAIIQSQPGEGCRVRVLIPYRKKREADEGACLKEITPSCL